MRWLAGGLGLMVVAACGSDTLFPGDVSGCPAELVPKVNVLRDGSVAALEVATRLRAEVAVVCANIATGLGAAGVPDVSDAYALSDDEVNAACALANQAIQDAPETSSFSITFAGGYCRVDATSQLACESQLSNGSCQPGDVESRCPMGASSGSCSASCEGRCVGTSECAGTCNGICDGMCSGSCGTSGPGTCDSLCTGSCDGQCKGECGVFAPASACDGVCVGGCSAPFEELGCTEPLDAAPCNLEPACAEACAALGALGAECVSPTAYIEGMGTFELTLKSNLPVLLGLVELEIPMALEGTQALATALAGLPPADAGNVCADTFAQMVQRVSDAASVLNVALGAPIDVIETTRP